MPGSELWAVKFGGELAASPSCFQPVSVSSSDEQDGAVHVLHIRSRFS